MDINQFQFEYPESLIATERSESSRVLFSDKKKDFCEISKQQLLDQFQINDVLVINNTKVQKRRIISEEGFEILFIEKKDDLKWQVLFPSSRLKKNQILKLPDNIEMSLIEGGIPQSVSLSKEISDDYFESFGQMALPPYIQKARGERLNRDEDKLWYQTDWAENMGSCAAPTASLHFSNKDLFFLKDRGVKVVPVTLHVGLGTFLPIRVQNILDHKMHFEEVSVSKESLSVIHKAKSSQSKIYALGTTVTRTLESLPFEYLKVQADGSLRGKTDLFLYPGVKFNYVDALLTNFHQPGSSLMALVSAFAGLDRVKSAYHWAIEKEFKLFSYGDLSLWLK